MVRCLIGFGSNTGDVLSWLEQTVGLLERHPEIEQLKYSPPQRTKAVLGEPESDQLPPTLSDAEYLNSVISLETSLDAKRLFQLTRSIETDLGRVRSGRWTARTVDLDVLLFGDQVIETDSLTIPHLRMSFRKFVLQGAVEVAPEMVHPQSQVTLEALWHRVCHGPRKVLWLASDQQKSDEARRLRAKLSSTSEGLLAAECDAWEITVHPHTSIEQLKRHPIVAKDYSLLLYSGGGQSLNDAARWFGGPLLNLSNCESSFVEREIMAAIQAMD
jgi:2-amino-4-hydroxy-6-hydroxymethyldihydropteridine diphosphokinase